MSKGAARLYEMFALGIGILTVIQTANAACSYSQDPGWKEPYKFQFKLNVCQTSGSPVTSKVSFPAQYQIGGVPGQCQPSGSNNYECTSSSESILFDLTTPGNSNNYPSLTVSVNNEQCKSVTYCQSPNSNQGGEKKDDGMLSLGPFGTYPKPAAIVGLCVFCCLILGAIYLVYRRHRTYNRTISDEPVPRKNLWQLVCCSTHRETGSRYSKSKNNSSKTVTRNAGPQRKQNLEEGNPDYDSNNSNLNSLPLESVSINDLGSGVKKVPKSSVLVNLDDVKKPLPAKDRGNRLSIHLESNAKPKDLSLENQSSGTPTRARTIKRNQTISDRSRDIVAEEKADRGRNKSRGATHNTVDSLQSSADQISRSKSTKESIKGRYQNRDVTRSATTKRNDDIAHPEVAKSEKVPLTRGRSKKTSRINDSDNTTPKAHRSKTIGGHSQKTDDQASHSNKDSTPLGLIQRNKSLNLARGQTNKDATNSKLSSPDDDDDVPLLRAPGKVQNTQGDSTLQYERSIPSTAPKTTVTNSHYSDEIFDLYEDDKY